MKICKHGVVNGGRLNCFECRNGLFDEAIPQFEIKTDEPLPTSMTALDITNAALAMLGRKDDGDKIRMDLLDAGAIEVLSDVLTFGAKKYEAHNWRKGIKLSRLLAALLRHVFAIMRGEDNDPETGLPHAGHAMCCCMFLIWTMKHRKDMDDRHVT